MRPPPTGRPMQLRRTFIALLLATALPGCAWFGGDDGDEAGGGRSFSVAIKNSGSTDVQVKLEVLEGSLLLHEDSFDVPGGQTVERDVTYDANGTKQVRVTYSVSSDGRAASGTQENTFDPSTCAGTYRLEFEVRPDEELTLVGNHGRCDVDA